jgi:Na+/H+ antiporter NhaC
MRPFLDTLFVSRKKLTFLVDSTAAPVASISPVSSWIGFEIGLIQEQIDRIIEIQGTEDIGINTSGFGVFLQSIKYRYYPIFMIIHKLVLICSQRDAGSMLIAERKTEVCKRTDGGEGASCMPTDQNEGIEPNQPKKGTPRCSWRNMIVPILLLVRHCFIYPSPACGIWDSCKTTHLVFFLLHASSFLCSTF